MQYFWIQSELQNIFNGWIVLPKIPRFEALENSKFSFSALKYDENIVFNLITNLFNL